MDITNKPIILFEPKIFTDIILAALACDVEVSGLAKIQRDNNTYHVYGNPVIYDQYCSVIETSFNIEAQHYWIQNMVTRGRGNELSKYRLWWHSHAWSDVYLSHTDRRTIDQVFANNFDWLLAVVVNKRMDVYVELNIFQPIRLAPIPISEFSFTKRFTSECFRNMLQKRSSRIGKIVSSRVSLISERDNHED